MRRLTDALVERRPAAAPYLIGVTGGVAVGKSTLSAALVDQLVPAAAATATVVGSDAFLFPNAELEARALTMQKGFPASYDVGALRAAVAELSAGRPVSVPRYSHRTYDIEPGVTQRFEPADVVVVEGLHLTRFVGDLLDVTVHLEADEAVVEEWYVRRLASLVAAADDDPDSFYRLFLGLDADTVEAIARDLWATINLVNLRDHITPWRDRADLVVDLDERHRIVDVAARS